MIFYNLFSTIIKNQRKSAANNNLSLKRKIMKLNLTLPILGLFLGIHISNAQPIFEVPDTVCVGEILDIQHSGDSFTNVCLVSEANFLSYDISVEPIMNFPSNSSPLYSHIVQDVENFYCFSTIFDENYINRLDFGNSLNNTPTSTQIIIEDISIGLEGIQILNDNGNWWGFLVGGWDGVLDDEFLLRLDFGDNITNEPAIENLGNIGNLSFPHDLFITKENDEWIGLTSNKVSNSITRFNFGNSLSNIPTGTNLGNVGSLDFPTGFSPIRTNGNWYLLITNEAGDSFSRINFGNSLNNTPTGEEISNLNFIDGPRDISVTKFCDNFLGILVNRVDGEVTALSFGNDIENTPTSTTLGNFGNFDFPHSITESHVTDEGVVIFVDNKESKEISRIDFILPFGLNVTCGVSLDEIEVSYPSPGIYTLQLLIDEGLPTQSSFCQDIFVAPPPVLDLGQDTSICFGKTITLESNFSQTIWQDGFENGATYEVNEEGIYYGEVSIGECISMDTIVIVSEDCSSCFIFPNGFTPNGDLVNDNFQPVIECGAEVESYQLVVFNRWGQKVFQTNDPSVGWDGSFNNKISTSDVYVWKAFFSYYKGFEIVEESLVGDVSLIR